MWDDFQIWINRVRASCYRKIHLKGIDINDIIHHIRGDISIDFYERQGILCKNAGVFPIKDEIVHKFCLQVIKDCQNIDILGSYLWEEEYLSEELISCKRVNLEAFMLHSYGISHGVWN